MKCSKCKTRSSHLTSVYSDKLQTITTPGVKAGVVIYCCVKQRKKSSSVPVRQYYHGFLIWRRNWEWW